MLDREVKRKMLGMTRRMLKLNRVELLNLNRNMHERRMVRLHLNR